MLSSLGEPRFHPEAASLFLPSHLPSPHPPHRPGPNQYTVKLDSKPAIALKFRHEREQVDPGPSPVDYADYHFRRDYKGGKTFGTSRSDQFSDNGSPGPIYSPDIRAARPRPKSFSMPRSSRSPGSDNQVPGPGTYFHAPVFVRDAGHGVRSDERSAPAANMAGKPYDPRVDDTPG